MSDLLFDTCFFTNDLWIAACAMQHAMPVVTRNVHEFSRIPGLRLVTY